MYEDSWYNFVPELSKQQPTNASAGHRRRASTLLQQPNGTGQDGIPIRQAPIIVDEAMEDNGPPRATVPQRAASFSDLGRAARDTTSPSKSVNTRRDEKAWDALMIGHDIDQLESLFGGQTASEVDSLEAELLDASQENYLLYRDQLLLTERHLDGLIHDANETLELLTKLSTSFQSVEEQTSTFRSRCDELLMEQDKLRKVHDGVENDMRYYAYLETASRRLNAPGASKLVDDSQFADMMEEIDSCISFMAFHDKYRERDSYLARYEALLAKALHLLDIGFTTHLDKVSSDIARQISANTSQSTWHALAYGRFEELMTNSYSLLPNVQRVMRLVFDEYGNRLSTTADTALYANTATSMMRTYLTTRDRDLKQLTQHDISEYQKQAQDVSVETASRNLIKQVFERMQHEASILTTLFDLDIAWNASPESAFQTIRGVHTSMAHPANMTPLATRLQTVLQTAGLKSVCNVVGWVANEYSIAEVDDEETAESMKLREYAARLLAEHLWPFTDAAFEAEVAKSITKATVDDSSLKISEVVDNIAWSNAHPLTKTAIELLSMFDQAMPKERSTKNSKVIFTIVRETIQVLQRAEARIKTLRLETDSDLFMVKNLLIVKNELVSLEIGDIRGNQPANMQHFTQIWDTLSPQNWAGFLGSMLPSSFWGGSAAAAPSVTAKTLTVEDMSEQLDELLRQSIYGFTKRWGDQLRASRQSKGKATATKDIEGDLDSMLRTAFSGQPEVITKLFEAIEIHAEEGGAETS